MKKDHTIFVEKYRPTTLDNFICDENHLSKFKEYVEKQDIPHLLLAGPAGSGKTTLAKILVNNIDCEFLIMNATDERSIDTIRTKVGGFASTRSFKPLKIVILDECLDENTLVTVLRKGDVCNIKIKDLDDKNDLVKSFNEKSNKIQWMPFELFDKGIRDCYEIEFENNEVVVCTETHKWYVDDEKGNPVVVTTKEIIEKGYILTI
jgi:replication factor C small subunit